MNICDLLDQHTLIQPDHEAIIDGERTITFRELGTLIRKTAAHLVDLGVKQGDHVGVCLKDNADHLIAMLAVTRMGGVVLPVDWRAKAPESKNLTAVFGVSLVLTEDGANSIPDTPSVALDAVWHAAVARSDGSRDFPHDSDAPAVIGLTSGTTGIPKGVALTHAHEFARTLSNWFGLDLQRNERYFSIMPLSFHAGRSLSFRHLMVGNTVILYPSLFRAEELVDAIDEYRATVFSAVPTVLRRLLELPEQPGPLLPGLRRITGSSAAMYAEEKSEVMRRLSPNYYEIYASSGGGYITILRSDDIEKRADSVGQPAYLTEVQIVDEDDKPLPAGETGRLRCRGPGVSTGFFNDIDDPSGNEMFRDGWCYTGEIAAMDEASYVRLKGRISEQIIRGGINIDPGEIERALHTRPAITEAAVVGRPSKGLGEEVVAYVATKGTVDVGELSVHCRNLLST